MLLNSELYFINKNRYLENFYKKNNMQKEKIKSFKLLKQKPTVLMVLNIAKRTQVAQKISISSFVLNREKKNKQIN